MRPHISRIALIGLLSISPAARAQIVAYDGFAYPSGQNLAGQNGGTGFAGPWSGAATGVIAAGSLPANSLTTTGNSVSGVNNEFIADRYQRTLAAPLGADGTTRWLSFVMQRTVGASATGGIVIGSSAGQGNVLGLLVGDPAANEFYSLSRQGGTGGPTASSGVPVTSRALLVVRLLFAPGNDTFDLFVNPPPGSSPPATPDASLSFDLGTGNSLVELGGGPNGVGVAGFAFDELRIGNTFVDVTPVSEPSALLLTGAAAVGLLAARRRRSGRPEVRPAAEDTSAGGRGSSSSEWASHLAM